jgi:4-hydroxythreonine-4-phosphate dehydrogenase
MIYITQGHESGVGLEIFIKAFLCLPTHQCQNFTLITNQDSLTKTLNSCKLDYTIKTNTLIINNKKLTLIPIKNTLFQTTQALNIALERISSRDTLITLPSSKDQIVELKTNKHYQGHTDYFRSIFKNQSITMNFLSPELNVLLLTDHIELSKIYENLNVESILEKIEVTLNNLKGIREIENLYFAGINPHCGESGLISTFDQTIMPILSKLEKKYPSLRIHPFVAADTIMFNTFSNKDLVIFSYHDQGLIAFKQHNGLIGINLTLGLPFMRMSVDHGTAFDLYGKNKANYHGMLYLLEEVIKNPTFVGL